MEINVLVEEGISPEFDSEWMQHIVEEVLVKENLPPNVEISLVITGQERIQELNREYRGKDQPTDVLSFSLSEQKKDEPETFINPPDGLIHLGEVLVSYPQTVLQARERGHSSKKEMAVLIIHGVLHILGYDHEIKSMAPAMEAREKEILEGLIKEIE
jgi:probable rRNA maturation factor